MKRVINHRPLSEDPDDQHLRVFLTDLGASSKKRYVTSLHNSYDGPFPNNGRYVGFAACYFEDLQGARKDFLTRDISQYNRVGVLEKISKPSIAKVESKGVDNINMKLNISIPKETVDYVMGDCDSRYWCRQKHQGDKVFISELLDERTEEYGPWIELTEKRRVRGFELLAEKAPYAFADVITGDFDSSTGDCWLQLAILGEIKYG